MTSLILFTLFGAISVQGQTGPICYSCDRTENPEQCRNSVTCGPEQMCSVQEVILPHGEVYFWSGCEDYEVCDELSVNFAPGLSGVSAIIGKRASSKDDNRCVYCCSTDLCNRNCTSFVNLALHKPAYQSSTAYNGPAQLAVDGNATKNYYVGSCTHTDKEPFPWWTVDLQHDYHITQVRIHERDDAAADGRTLHLKVLVSSYNATLLDRGSTQFTECGGYYGHSSEGNTILIDCPKNTVGRWVRIQEDDGHYEQFHLCEVEVFGF